MLIGPDEIVIRSPFSAGISVLNVDEQTNLKVALDGRSLESESLKSSEVTGCHLVTLNPMAASHGTNAVDTRSEEYEYRLSVH